MLSQAPIGGPPAIPPGGPPSPIPVGTPTNTVPQNILGNLAGFGAMGIANIGTTAVNNAAGLGSAEASVVALVQNFVAQLVKNHPHFDEQHWIEPFMAVAGLPFAFFFWHQLDPITALFKTVVTSIQGSQIAKVQYRSAQATVAAGAMQPVPPANEYANNAHPWPSPNSPGWGMGASAQPSAPPAFRGPLG